MSLKRQNTSSPEVEEANRPTKRQRPSWIDELYTSEHPTAREQPRVDFSSGQQSAFPGVDDDNNELIYGEPEDGLQYLRMVRSERRKVPHILVAEQETQPRSINEEDEDYDDDFYHPDRAWIAAPDPTFHENSGHTPHAQDLYYLALLDRFAQLQARLKIAPPLSAIGLLSSSQPISFPPGTAKAREKWRTVTETYDPSPTQLACMDPESVMELMKLLTQSFNTVIKDQRQGTIRRFGTWIWAILARCRDRGELSSEEIAELRELGKQAVRLLDFVQRSQSVEVKEAKVMRYELATIKSDDSAEVPEEGGYPSDTAPRFDKLLHLEVPSDDVRMLERAKAQISSMLESTDHGHFVQPTEEGSVIVEEVEMRVDASKQIHMLLDTTITIVGEVYGQRDLLDHRDIWG